MQFSFEDVNNGDEVIDIRSKLQYDAFHYPNSIHITKDDLLSNPEVYLDKNKKYYIICTRGTSSLLTARILNVKGYECYSILGGINAYKGR
ncbi:MAG: rhodanese-like domain-containing protein [Bacilli bacterium]